MRWLSSTLCLLLAACAQVQRADLAIRGATVVDVTDGSLASGQTVLVEGNRIVAVGPADAVRVPDEADVVEAAGGFLIPGLWDAHVHAVDPAAEGTAEPSITTQDRYFPLFLAHGVTGVRNMNDHTGDVTLELTNSVRRRLAEGDLVGPPRFLSAGPSLKGDPPLFAGSDAVVVRTAAEARDVVDALADAGADFVKPYENLSREAYFAMVDQARRRGLPVDGHLPFRITPEEAAEAGQRTVEHPDALAQGCVPAADFEAERERFASVLADYDSLTESERSLVQFRHYRAVYDLRDSSRLPVDLRDVPPSRRRGHRGSDRVSPHRALGGICFGHGPHEAHPGADPSRTAGHPRIR